LVCRQLIVTAGKAGSPTAAYVKIPDARQIVLYAVCAVSILTCVGSLGKTKGNK